jgi:hypothetical protein
MRSRLFRIDPFAWMIGLAAATASSILLLGAVGSAVGPSLYFQRLFTDPYLLLATLAHIGCAFVAGLCIAQAVVLLRKAATNRRP